MSNGKQGLIDFSKGMKTGVHKSKNGHLNVVSGSIHSLVIHALLFTIN